MRRSTHLSLLGYAVACLALLSSPALAANPRWEQIGPYGHDGSRLFPTGDPAILYVTTNYSGLYRSEDGGQSWREVNPVQLGALSVDPRDPDVLFGAPGIYEKVVRSVDGGRTFTQAADGLLYQDQNPQILSFVRDPADPGVVFAATEFGLFRFDGVSHWDLIAFGGFAVTAFAIDPLSPAVWLAATNDFDLTGPGDVLISKDAGATWNLAPGEIDRRAVGTTFFDPVRPHRAYTLANCRPAVFTDGAWHPLPLAAPKLTCTMTITEEGRLVAFYFDAAQRLGVVASDDGGETWVTYSGPGDVFFRIAATAGDVMVASGGRGLWRSTDGGATWRAASRGITGFVMGDIAVAADGAVFASPGGEGVFRSRDAGRSWQRLVQGLHADAQGTPALAVDPRDPAVVWAGGVELHRSRDAGRTWQGLSLTQGAVEGRVIRQIVVDPTREGVVYVLTYAPIGPGFAGPFVYRTLDDGRSWQPLPRLHRLAEELAVAPSDGTLYASSGGGLFVSRDAGSTWRQVQRSLPLSVRALAVDPGRSDILWLGSYESGMWRSTDGGHTLVSLQKGEILFGQIESVVFDPADPAHPYVSPAAQGVYQWRHDGWRKVGAPDSLFESTVNGPLAFDAERGILYAGTSTRGIYRLR